jgi:hypothetical protein
MAKIDAKGKIRGKYLNATFRVLNGENILQGKSVSQKQTTKTKQAASDFGIVQTSNRLCRELIQYALQNYQDKKMHTRLNSIVLKEFHLNKGIPLGQRNFYNTNLQGVVGFDFNINTPFKKFCTLPINFTKKENNQLIITIDKFLGKDYFWFNSSISEIRMELFILHRQLNYMGKYETQTITFNIQKDKINLASEWIVENTLHDSITIITGQLWYLENSITKNEVMRNSIAFHPSCILYLDNGI